MPFHSSLRSWAGRARRKLWPRRFILVYHRVAENVQDPWNLAVSPKHFDEQLDVLRTHGPVLSLGRMLRELDAGTLPSRAAAITFDDGYADNLLAAAPLLRRHDVPATVFLSPGLLDGRTSFWWDALARAVFDPETLPDHLDTRLGSQRIVWEHPAAQTEATAAEVTAAKAAAAKATAVEATAVEAPDGWRRNLYMRLWGAVLRLPPEARQSALAELAAWAGLDDPNNRDDRPLSQEEAARLAAEPQLEIGAHTLTHPRLSACDHGRQRAEIEGSKAACEEIAGARVDRFSYPYGDWGPQTAALVREAGFTSAWTTVAAALTASTDRFLMPRIPALDWNGAQLERCLATVTFT